MKDRTKPSKEFIDMLNGVLRGEKWTTPRIYKYYKYYQKPYITTDTLSFLLVIHKKNGDVDEHRTKIKTLTPDDITDVKWEKIDD